MAVIKIRPSIKVSDFDALYKELFFIIEHGGTIDIELAPRINRIFFALTSTLIQFIATWVRSERCGQLLLDVQENGEDFKDLYEQEHIFPILALIWNDIPIVNTNGVNLRAILRPFQNDFILRMRGIQAFKGEKLLLVNLDHFDNHTGILPVFERKDDFITNEERLHESLKEPIFEQVLKYARHSKNTLLEAYGEIAGIIYELMKNTFDWARQDELGVPLSPNIRGVYVRFFKKKRSLLLTEYYKDLPIRSYFNDETIFQENELGQVYFLEISVFDSGRGFINKFVNDQQTILSDVDIIKKCLLKNQTSAVGLLSKKKGIGLDRILQSIDKKGFLRIKTDKYCLYRDMIKSPYQPLDREHFSKIELSDWDSGSREHFSKGYLCAGTSISILYPLSNLYLS